jgi:IclR family KDG regulon transcriptional repressor
VKFLVSIDNSRTPTIKSVEKALDILEQLARERTMTSLKSLSKNVRLNQSTVFRILRTLEQRGYVEQDASTKQYGLGMKVIELGSSLLEEMEIYTQALPFMQKIRDECNETVALGILKEDEVFILASATASRPDSL